MSRISASHSALLKAAWPPPPFSVGTILRIRRTASA
jgi:hypothetical protein